MIPATLQTHLEMGVTTLARCWSVKRPDGTVLGFTDHDRDLRFEGVLFRADTGMTGAAIDRSTGLSVDNGEVMGALSDASIRADDIDAGRYDDAAVTGWLVNWADVTQRVIEFRGTLGEIRREGGAFEAELRGLTEALNRPFGAVFQAPCGAVLGDGQCRVDLSSPIYRLDIAAETVREARVFGWAELGGYAPGWFDHGRVDVLDGAGAGLWAPIKRDLTQSPGRVIELWEPIRAAIAPGDMLRLTAGCDKRFATCGGKFANHLNFRGFPDIPEEDWVVTAPAGGQGGSRR